MVGQEMTINAYLRRLRLEVAQLPILASIIADEPPDVRDVWYWQWEELMCHVTALCEQHRLQQLSDEQEREFNELMGQFASVTSVLETLGWCVPDEVAPQLMPVELFSGETIEV